MAVSRVLIERLTGAGKIAAEIDMTVQMDGGGSIVAWLKAAGVANVFSVSGGPINSIYRACTKQGLPLIHARHEAAACFMAESASRVTGKAGCAVVTLGPGVTNAVTPALVATMAGTPMIIIGAHSGTSSFERGAGMSYDVLPVMKGVTKWAARCIDANRLTEYLDIAWRKMWAGRPGPVFLEVPTDILSSAVDAASGSPLSAPPAPSRPGVSMGDAEALRALCKAAKRPLLLLGDETFWDRSDRIQEAVDRHGLPFSTLRLARGIVDETQERFAGPGYTACNGALRRALAEADCVLLVGHHFEFDLEFGDTLGPDTKVIQVASDTELLNRNRRADLAIAASPSSFFDVLADAPAMQPDSAWISSILADWAAEWKAQRGEGDDFRIRQARHRFLQRQRLYPFADAIDLKAFLQVQPGHPGAAAGLQHHQPVAFQAGQRAAHRDAADGEAGGELFLADAAARGQLAGQDQRAQFVRHPLGAERALARRCAVEIRKIVHPDPHPFGACRACLQHRRALCHVQAAGSAGCHRRIAVSRS